MNTPLLVTLDNNCIIDLEQNEEPHATAVKTLIALQEKGVITLAIGGVR